jgi:hypothetical protein
VKEAAYTVDASDLMRCFDALKEVDADLRKRANGEIRDAALTCADRLAIAVRVAGAASPTPAARLVAPTARPKRDRIPSVEVGTRTRVGHSYQSRKSRRKQSATAKALAWGTERGGKDGIDAIGRRKGDRFGAGRDAKGFWIAPTVKRFESTTAVQVYLRAVYDILRRNGLA